MGTLKNLNMIYKEKKTMCGFVGFIDKLNKEEKQKSIKLMADRIIHRGPDQEGYYVDDNSQVITHTQEELDEINRHNEEYLKEHPNLRFE